MNILIIAESLSGEELLRVMLESERGADDLYFARPWVRGESCDHGH